MTKFIHIHTVGEILKEEFLDEMGISQNALAKAINVPANRIHQIVNGTRRITTDTDLRLTKYLGMSEGFFIRLQDDYEMRIAKRKISNELLLIVPYSKSRKNLNR